MTIEHEGFTLLYWHWVTFGLVLMVAEAVVPGAALLFIGASALATGVVAYVFPGMGWEWQCVQFGVLSVISFMIFRRLFRRNTVPGLDPMLNKRFSRLIGHVITLESPIVNGQGRIAVNDTSMLVAGPDLPAGTKVRITGIEGAVLVIEEVKG